MPSHPRIANLVIETGYKDLKTPTVLTSGEIGIYYINGENVAQDGGAWKADNLSNDATAMKNHAVQMTREHPSFGEVIEIMSDEAERVFRQHGIPHQKWAISGGQRRDWLFSGPVSYFLDCPHIGLYKGGKVEVKSSNDEITYPDAGGLSVIHASDLLTKASSSYDVRKSPPTGWIPMTRGAGGDVIHYMTLVDRLQGGEAALHQAGVSLTSFVQVNADFLNMASQQKAIALDYIRDPRAWSERYLREHGIDAFVNWLSPESLRKEEDPRGPKFLVVYSGVLSENGGVLYNALREQVLTKYGFDIDTLPKTFVPEEE